MLVVEICQGAGYRRSRLSLFERFISVSLDLLAVNILIDTRPLDRKDDGYQAAGYLNRFSKQKEKESDD